jgi:hypothetical protein
VNAVPVHEGPKYDHFRFAPRMASMEHGNVTFLCHSARTVIRSGFFLPVSCRILASRSAHSNDRAKTFIPVYGTPGRESATEIHVYDATDRMDKCKLINSIQRLPVRTYGNHERQVEKGNTCYFPGDQIKFKPWTAAETELVAAIPPCRTVWQLGVYAKC